MALYMVSYDLDKPGQDYPDLITRLETIKARRILFSQWFLISERTPEQVRDDLQRFLDSNDRILVVELKNHAAWKHLMISNDLAVAYFKRAT
jgi:hypothetical protein